MTSPLPMFAASAGALALEKKKKEKRNNKRLFQFRATFKKKLKKSEVFLKKNIGKIEKETELINIIANNQQQARKIFDRDTIKYIKKRYNYIPGSLKKKLVHTSTHNIYKYMKIGIE